jgi:predicted outer membrane repeat protein
MSGGSGTFGPMSVSNLTIRAGKSASSGGGLKIGINAGYNGDILVERVYFDRNFAATIGGGAVFSSDGGTVTVRNNWFLGNQCDSNYCAAEVVTNYVNNTTLRAFIGNNTVVANSCGLFAADTCDTGGFTINGSARVAVFNNAFAFSEGNDLRLAAGSVDLYGNNINQLLGTPTNAGGNLAFSDPMFVNPFADDYHLQFVSPLRDGGTGAYDVGMADFDGNPRLNDGQYDIGAFENSDILFRNGFEVVL